MEEIAATALTTVTGGFNPLLLALAARRGPGALQQAAIGQLVAGATRGIVNPIARAMVNTQITTKLTTGHPATSQQLEQSAVRGAIQSLARGSSPVE